MYYYKIGYWSFEETSSYTLMNENEFTEEQFDELVVDCIASVFKENKSCKNFEKIINKVIKMLEDEFGFKQPIVKASFIPFGWANFDDPDDWKPQVEDDKLELIRSKVAKNRS